jgi:hypothetical protein
MNRVEELIKYYQEGESLDFKQEEYRKETFPKMVKDVLSFANADCTGDRYIIIGVKKNQHKISLFNIESQLDPANIEQYILENITPDLKIAYEPHTFEGHNILVLRIVNPQNQPYETKRDIFLGNKIFLRQYDRWIRKGTHQMPMTREDLDNAYLKRYKIPDLKGKIDVRFENGEKRITIPCLNNINLPSEENKREIENEIHWKEDLRTRDPQKYYERFGNSGVPHSDIKEMTLDELYQRQKDVKMNYADEDKHYLYEKRASLINFEILNDGTCQLENAMIVADFPVIEGLTIANRVFLNTVQIVVVTGENHQYGYPAVIRKGNTISVSQDIGTVRHHFPKLAFVKPLRVTAFPDVSGKAITVNVHIHASNLSEPELILLEITFN